MVSDKSPADLQETARTLHAAAIHLLRGVRVADRRSGLTPARLSALSVLVFGGPMPLGRLAKIEGVASPTMTRIVDGLCDLGLARRQPHPDSSRIAMVSSTEPGIRLMHAAAERRVELIVAALRRLSPSARARVREAAPEFGALAEHVRDHSDALPPTA